MWIAKVKMRRSDSTRATSQLIILIGVVAAIIALYFARVVLVPLALAILFAFLLNPIVRLVDKLRVPRIVSSVGVVAIAVIGMGVIAWVVTGELVDIANQLPYYRSNIKTKLSNVYSPKTREIKKAATALNEIGQEIVDQGTAPAASASPRSAAPTYTNDNSPSKPVPVQVQTAASSPLESLNTLAGPLSVFLLVTVFTLFMLIRREDLRNRFIKLVGHQYLNVMTQALDDAGTKVIRYLFLQLSVNLGYGFTVGLGLYFIGVPHVLLWGLVAALLRFLPYVGALLSGLLPILLAIAMFDGWTRPLLTIGLYVAAELVVSNLVEPLLYGAQVGISSLAILVAAVFWTVLWGPVGLVLSTPLTVCLAVMGRYVPNLGFLGIILGDEPVLAPESHFYQRLLASDQHEARLVLEEYLKEHTLTQLYDSVVIPALALAEQDRHRNDLDEETERFIALNTKQLIEELSEREAEISLFRDGDINTSGPTDTEKLSCAISSDLSDTIVCIPARDNADEMVGTMLSQLLEQSGRRSRCIPIGPMDDLLTILEGSKPAVICISALPPLAVSHARHLYIALRKQFPDSKILIGLWNSSRDAAKIAERMRLNDGDRIFNRLEEVLAELKGSSERTEPSEKEADQIASEIK